MKFSEQYLSKDEKIIYSAKLHWWIYAPAAFAACACLLMSLVIGAGSQSAAMGFGVFFIANLLTTLPAIIGALIKAKTSEFVVTNKRILAKYGFIRRTTFENLLSKVEGLTVEQSIFGRMLNFGTVWINGVGGSKTAFPAIEKPMELRRVVQDQLEIAAQPVAK